MERKVTRTLLLGLVGGFIGISLAQGAKACDEVSTTIMPDSAFLTTPTLERVVTSSVLIDRPMTVEKVITSPATVEKVISSPIIIERKERRHLLDFGLLNFGLF